MQGLWERLWQESALRVIPLVGCLIIAVVSVRGNYFLGNGYFWLFFAVCLGVLVVVAFLGGKWQLEEAISLSGGVFNENVFCLTAGGATAEKLNKMLGRDDFMTLGEMFVFMHLGEQQIDFYYGGMTKSRHRRLKPTKKGFSFSYEQIRDIEFLSVMTMSVSFINGKTVAIRVVTDEQVFDFGLRRSVGFLGKNSVSEGEDMYELLREKIMAGKQRVSDEAD